MSITGKLRNQFRFRFYRNLNKGGWSVAESNLPVVNKPNLVVYEAQFYSRPAGRAQVIESGVKNVHAYMVSNSAYEDNHTYFYKGRINTQPLRLLKLVITHLPVTDFI